MKLRLNNMASIIELLNSIHKSTLPYIIFMHYFRLDKMASMIGLFSSIGEHVPIFRKEKVTEASAEGLINR